MRCLAVVTAQTVYGETWWFAFRYGGSMPDLQIRHVIFTRVERAYSLRNSSGYQIVYQSPTLGRETTQIEKHLQCFQTGGQRSNRYQFFWTGRDQVVLAKSIPLLQPDR